MVKRFHYDSANRQEWLALRRELSGIGDDTVCRIGASDTWACLGRSPYKSRMRLWYELLGRTSGSFDTEKTANGLLMEEHIKNRYCYYSPNEEEHVQNMMTKTKVNKVRNVNSIIVSSEFDYIAASLDIERCKGGVNFFTGEVMDFVYPIDLKNLSFYSNQSKNDEISEGYEYQLYAQMVACECTYSELAVLSDGWRFKVHPCHYNEERVEWMKKTIKDFCDSVIRAKPLERLYQEAKQENDFEAMALYDSYISQLSPEPTGIEDDWKLMEELQDGENDDSILATDKDSLYYHRYKKAIRLEKLAAKIKDQARANLISSMDNYKYMKFQDHNGKVSHYAKPKGGFFWSVK